MNLSHVNADLETTRGLSFPAACIFPFSQTSCLKMENQSGAEVFKINALEALCLTLAVSLLRL